MRKLVFTLFSVFVLNADEPISLDNALKILNSQNLEIKAATLDVKAAKEKIGSVSGTNWGKLDFVQDVAKSDSAGNVFGFKLESREADFGDFGFSEFLPCMSATPPASCSNPLTIAPKDLNYPDARNFFQSKIKYELPIFTGFQISSYTAIMESMAKMKTLDKDKVINEKIYQLKKSYYDMALLENSINNLNIIMKNIDKLERMTNQMIEVGYAKKSDLLEVQAKKGNVERLISQMNYNEKLLYHFIGFLLNQKVDAIEIPKSNIEMPSINDEDILKNNLDIQRASTGLEIRESMVDVQQSNYYPMIGAFAELSTADDTFLGEASDHKAYTVGARLTWNIFNGGVDASKVEEAQIEKLKTKSQVELARHGIKLQIAKLRTEIETQDAEVAFLEKELKLANEIYKNYEGRYKEKLSSMSDVIIKQSQQIEKILELQMAQNKRNERIFALIKLANGDK
ncbi:TolC family protein [Sulfurimonas lithotrophica]|uniref:TolC family protein n=1 Tax=Sulfurimonas lithotrophica TaxID=2590022 RepID=A0A5P8P091_9BACT|nr:TolC family protein [Sulfurimonas lithotrophica]QFR49128.1 TolC family protein [Sulfurimonas lithotrophica]